MRTKSQLRYLLKHQYAHGAKNAVGLLLDCSLHYKLSAEEAMQLLVCFSEILERMARNNDRTRPFNTRAISAALEEMEIDSYETAYKRIAEKYHKQIPTSPASPQEARAHFIW